MDLPIHRKFGYAHMVEMSEINAIHRASGLSGAELHFACVRTYEQRHKDDPTFRQKQESAKARGEPWMGTPAAPTPEDLLRRALEAIRDGHNDPRALAREVLEATKSDDD